MTQGHCLGLYAGASDLNPGDNILQAAGPCLPYGTGELQASVGCWLKAVWVRESMLSNSLHGTESLARGENCSGSLGISPSSPSGSSAVTAIAKSSVLQVAGAWAGWY